MIPDFPNLAEDALPGAFKQPYALLKEPLCDWARGGSALLDATEGLDVKDWRIDMEDGVCTISSEGSPDFVVPNIPIEANWISFAFDQNMHYNVTYSVGNTSYLYWYDAVVQGYVTTELGNAKTPFLRMDDSRNHLNGVIDLIVSYLKKGGLYIRLQSERFENEHVIEAHAGNKLLGCGPTNKLRFQWKTTVIYPEDLPCPQADTDLVPRERRYISDIEDVHNFRMFQQEFQATRNKISFVFTEEEAGEFREWYEDVLIHGGAWFYADWPTLHRDKEIAHRFVDQPKYEWLFGGNPGKMGRSRPFGGGYMRAEDSVTMYKVTATVELYERKVENVYKTELYPLIISDDISASHHFFAVKPRPFIHIEDAVTSTHHSFALSEKRFIYSDYEFADDVTAFHHNFTLSQKRYLFTVYEHEDDIKSSHHTIVSGQARYEGRILYDYMQDDVTASHHFFTVGETT